MADYRLSATLSVKDQMTAKLRAAQRAAESLTRGVGSLKNQDLKWRVGVEGLEKIKRLQSMAKGMKFSPIRITAQDNATPKLSQLKSQLSSVAGKAHNVIVNVKTNGAEKLRGLKSNLSEMGNGMLMATGAGVMGLAGVGYGIADTIKTYKDFDYQMRRNQALFTAGMDAQESERIYQQLTETARKYGSTMIFTNAEVGKALEYMALAGWDANTSMKALPAILNAAVSSGEDLAMVSDIITDDMTAMGYKAGTYVKNGMGEMVEATQHFSDVLLRTTLRSNTNFQQLGYAMKYAAPLAHSLGYSIEDVAIAMGLMANNGIKADQAGTALRGLLVRMAKAPKQAAEAMEALGVSMFDAEGKSKGLMQNLMQIRAALKGKDAEKMLDFVEAMTGEEIGQRGEVADFLKEEMSANGGKLTDKSLAKLASQFSGTYALAGFLAMMNSTDEDIQKLMTEIYQKSDGTGKEINVKMMDTLQGDLKTLQSAWEDFQTELMSGKGADGLRSFLQAATKDINAFKTALKDGFDIGDLAGLVGNVVTQLKSKFLELDGIGSILAGGVLMVGLRKLLNMGLKVKTALGEIMKLGAASTLAGSKTGTLSAGASNVGTMNVRAGVVNLSGAIKGAGTNGLLGNGRGNGAGSGSRQVSPIVAAQREADKALKASEKARLSADKALAAAWANPGKANKLAAYQKADLRYQQAEARYQEANRRVTALRNSQLAAEKYYVDRGNAIAKLGMNQMLAEAKTARLANMKSAAGGGAMLAALFGAMDVFSTRSMGKMRLDEADAEIKEQQRILSEIRAAGASQEQIQNQIAAIHDLETARNGIIKQNAADERLALAGATGSVAGTALGAALGSLVGPLGTMLGGVIGGVIGDYLGRKAGELGNERENAKPTADVFGFDKPRQEQLQLGDSARRRAADIEESARRPYENLYGIADAQNRRRHADDQERATQIQFDRFQKIDDRLKDWSGSQLFNRPVEQATQDFYRQKATQLPKAPEFKLPEFKVPDLSALKNIRSDQSLQPQKFETQPQMKLPEFKLPEFKVPDLSALKNIRSDQSLQPQKFETQPQMKLPEFKLPEFKLPEFNLGEMLSGLFFSKAAAAELNEAQLAQQAQMERGVQPSTAPTEMPEMNTEGLTGNILSQLQGLGEGVGEIFSNLGTSISEGLTTSLEGVGEIFSQLGTSISEGLTTSLEGVGEIFSQLGTSISEGLTTSLEGVSETLSMFGTTIQEGLATAFTGVGETFSQLGATIQSGLESARAAAESSMSSIQASFNSGISAIQSAWGALPGFFSGIFSGLGGAASAAGAAIAAGLTACIGSVIGAWQSAASTIQGIISSIASAGAGLGAGIGGHYMGTASFEGGFTEINEHGGELMMLPQGTKIYPHATTVALLRKEISDRMDNLESANTFGDFNLPVPKFNLPNAAENSTPNSTTNNSSTSNSTFNFGGVTINNAADFDEFVHRLQIMFKGSASNSASF